MPSPTAGGPLTYNNKYMSKIQLSDTTSSMVAKISEGNPGAINVLLQMLKGGDTIDPQAAMGGVGAILNLDAAGIYGSSIWMLYKDVCNQSLVKMLAVLRAWQLGQLPLSVVLNAIDNGGDGLDVDAVLWTVKESLSEFDRPPAVLEKV